MIVRGTCDDSSSWKACRYFVASLPLSPLRRNSKNGLDSKKCDIYGDKHFFLWDHSICIRAELENIPQTQTFLLQDKVSHGFVHILKANWMTTKMWDDILKNM